MDKDSEFKKVVTRLLNTSYNLNEDCVKVWGRDEMLYNDVIRGCDHVKELGYDTIVYNNIVPLKSKISEELGINILDGNDLIQLFTRNHELDEFEDLIRYNI